MTSQSRPNPYIGPRAFQDGETLYGREREVAKLLNLLIAERIVLLYSPSGAGKTSLVQAALIPELREEGFQVLPVIRVGLEPAPDLELPATANRYILSTLLSLEEGLPLEQQTALAELVGMDLATYLDQRPAKAGETDGDVLIFDQFEEILTVDPTDQKTKAAFFAQLGKALRDRQRWALFAMREEYPAGLDPYLRPVPTRLSTTFRLELLGAKAARQAMQEPARPAGVPFADTAAEKLIDDLRRVQVQQPDGTTAERPGLYIEPVQLQVVCYRLWENLPDEATEIRETDIREAGDVDSALAGYYADWVKTTAENTGVRERVIREWFDSQLITEQGIRGQVLRGPEQSQGLENQAIEPLVDAHLVRAENRRGATWYELAHDRLIRPVKEDNADWREKHLSPLQRQAALWESQSRSSGLLLRDNVLVEAEAWAESHENDLITIEREFLSACREARTQAQKEHRKNRFIQGLAIVATLIMLVAIYFFVQARQAENTAIKAKNEAEEARVKAEERREEAENAKAKAEHQSHISLTQVLAFQAIFQSQNKADERAALLARQAYLFNQEHQVSVLHQVDNALRTVLSANYFSYIWEHESEVYSVAFSSDDRMLASGSDDGTVQLWNLTNPNTASITLDGHKGPILSVTFSPDGKILASGSADGTIRLWNLMVLDASPAILSGHKYRVNSVAFSPDGQILASGGGDTAVRLWDVASGNEWMVLRGHTGQIRSVAFSPNGRMLVSGSGDKALRLWDLRHPSITSTVLHGHNNGVLSATFSPDSKKLASGSSDSTVRVWDVTTGNEQVVLRDHEYAVNSVIFSPDGQSLASGSWDTTVRLWDLNDISAAPTVLHGHDDAVYSVEFSSDGQSLASASDDGTIRLWDLTTSDAAPIVRYGHKSGIRAVAFSPSDQRLASAGGADGTVRLWDLQNPIMTPIVRGSGDWVFSVAFSPDGRMLASGSNNAIQLWDLTTSATLLNVLDGHKGLIWSLTFSPDGRMLASGSNDKTVRLWDLTDPSNSPKILRGHEGYVYSVAFSPDGKILASGSYDKTVRLWDMTTPDAQPTILRGHKAKVRSVIFDPDGKTLASGSTDTYCTAVGS